MPRSKFSNYRNGIRMNLIMVHKWRPEKATVWLRENRIYIKYAYETRLPSITAANNINDLKRENANG